MPSLLSPKGAASKLQNAVSEVEKKACIALPDKQDDRPLSFFPAGISADVSNLITFKSSLT